MNRLKELVGCYFLLTHPIIYAEQIDPTHLSIEQLMESQISSVSKANQKFSDTAAAAYIITQNDIQRSGVTTIPDALRMAPGLHVARTGAGKWAITSRGFNGRFANNLLVLLNGRTLYSTTFAGIRWENLDLVLEDIERIEIIRGPGGSIWGQNAVNGVINIITKHSKDTQQGLASITSGNEEHAIVELRYGDQLNNNLHYRVFGKFLRRDSFIDLQGNNADDNLTQGRGGFRTDWNSNAGDRIMLEGDAFIGKLNDDFLFPTDNPTGPARRNPEQNSGANILALWEHDVSIASKIQTQFYYEYFNLIDSEFGSERKHTLDLDIQHDIAISKDNYFNWGLGYRFVADSFFNGSFSTVDNTHQGIHLASAFIQDKISFFDDALQLTLGTKVQYYTLSNWEFQPSARLLWKVHPEHRIWAAFSRATRSPSRGELTFGLRPVALPTPFLLNFVLQANSELDREQISSYELGYRGWLSNQLSLDIAFFYSKYEDLISASAGAINFATSQIPVSFANDASAKSWGAELAAEWRPINPLRLQFSYSFLQIQLSQKNQPRTAPEHQFSFHGAYDISPTITFDTTVRFVDSFGLQNILLNTSNTIDSYVGLDIRLAWKPIQNLELSFVGQNLNNKTHVEYADEIFAYPKALERSFFGKIQWYF